MIKKVIKYSFEGAIVYIRQIGKKHIFYLPMHFTGSVFMKFKKQFKL